MKVQYKSVPIFEDYDHRELLYRIDPSELSWRERIFKNPWKKVFVSFKKVWSFDNDLNDCLNTSFSYDQALEITKEYDTYEKLTDFLSAEYEAASEMWNTEKARRNGNWDF